MHRFFLSGPVADGTPLPLDEAGLHHLRTVLRITPGETIAVVEPDGRALAIVLTEVSGAGAFGLVRQTLESPVVPRVVLVQGLAKGERMDLVVRQTAELGVERIVPFAAERSVVRLDARKAEARAERWRRIALEAAQQSQQTRVPEVSTLVDMAGLVEWLAACSLILVAWEAAEHAPSIPALIAAREAEADSITAVVVGPEGGLTAGEVGALEDAGAETVSLGPTILRTETAAVVAVALTMTALSDRGGSRS